MTERDFRELVRRLRDAQRAYFRLRSRENLVRAKELEAEVDRALTQPALFGPKEKK